MRNLRKDPINGRDVEAGKKEEFWLSVIFAVIIISVVGWSILW